MRGPGWDPGRFGGSRLPPRVNMGVPQGFENFVSKRELLRDVYFGDNRRGQIPAIGLGETDAAGFFQIEIDTEWPGRLTLADRAGGKCGVNLQKLDLRDGLARAGTLFCTSSPP